MKSILSEVIKIELVKALLSEGRVEDAKAKYPNNINLINIFVNGDPSGNNKYLMWMMKISEQATPQQILDSVRFFHQNNSKFTQKDINQYRTFEALETVLEPIKTEVEKANLTKQTIEEGIIKLYEDTDWLLVRPLNHDASCKYGAGTQWCTTQRDNTDFFHNYSKDLLIYLLHKKSNYKFAFYAPGNDPEDGVEIYNPIDNDIAGDLDLNVMSFLNGLVSGYLMEYIQSDNYNDDDEWDIYNITPNGNRRHWTTCYDDSELKREMVLIIKNNFFGTRRTRMTLPRIKKILEVLGFKIIADKVKKGQPIPFSVNAIDDDFNITGDHDLKDWVEAPEGDDGAIDFIINILHDFEPEGELLNLFEKMELRYVIVGPGFDGEESKSVNNEVDSNNIMSKEQANKIYNGYLKAFQDRIDEKIVKQEQILNNLVEKLTLPKETVDYYMFCKKYDQPILTKAGTPSKRRPKYPSFKSCFNNEVSWRDVKVAIKNDTGRNRTMSFNDLRTLMYSHGNGITIPFDEFYIKMFDGYFNKSTLQI